MKLLTPLLTVLLLFSFVCFSVQQPNIVYTQYGPVDGLLYEDSRGFLGIPFAQPPVGNLRLEKPQPPEIWGPTPLWAKAFQAGCPQYCDLPPLVCPMNTSEDCLTLNVYTPLESTGLVPVMVFIPGGRFEDGASGTALYNSQYLANTSNVVVVTINYRLGALGFLVASDGISIISNLGFLDQQLALDWVQQNIAAFGGDPTQVTIFGQSAGGTSTALHLITPSSFGYYNKAIIESDPAGLVLPNMDQADKLSRRFRDSVGCKGDKSVNELKKCLQSKTIDEILNAQNEAQDHVNLFSPLGAMMPWSPVVDNIIILEQPMVAFYGGHFKPVPLMLGTVLEEALMFVFGIFPNGVADFEYEIVLVDVLRTNNEWEKANEYYPPVLDNKNATAYRLSNLSTDFLFVCPTRNITRSFINFLSPEQAQNVFLYRFIHVPSFYEAWGPNYTYCYFSVCHGAELPFVFHSADKVTPPYNYTAAEEILTQQMSNYWGNFAHTGNPNQGPSTIDLEWPVYQDSRLNSWENMVFGTPSYIEKNADNIHCNFWDNVGYLIP